MGGHEGILGGAVTDEGGPYTGERGLARRGLDAGERCEECVLEEGGGEELRREGEPGCAAAPWSVWAERGPVVLMLSLREKLGCGACDDRLLVVLCDQRFMLPAPSRKVPMPSAAPLAALERRLADGGGVAREVWGGLGASEFVFVSLSLSEAVRFTVTTEDEEMDVLCDEVRRCEDAAGSCWVGAGAGLECIFMLASEAAAMGCRWCLRTKPTLMQRGMQACCRCRNALDGRR